MNTRIKELAEAAYREVVCNPLNDFISRELVDQIFAELIIQECASLCEVRAWGMIEKGFPGHDAVEGCSDIIKQHFGVE